MVSSVRYLRRSKGKSAAERSDGLDTVSVEDQRLRVERIESACGYELAHEFIDDGVSSFLEGATRSGFELLCRLIASGVVDGAVVLSDAPDRLSRQGGEAYLAFRRLCCAHDVRIHTASHGMDDPADDSSEIPAFLAGWQAHQESKVKSRRLRNASTERARRGQQRGAGVTPFGWSRDNRLILDPGQAVLLRNAADRILKGASIRGVARSWNQMGVKTSRGGNWTHAGISAALTRPRNAGLMQLRREVVEGVTGEWEPLWDIDTHEALVAMMGNRALTQMTGTGGRRGYTATSLLAGIARCSCGGPMRLSRSKAQEPAYRCDARDQNVGPHSAIRQDYVENKVRQRLIPTMVMCESGADEDEPDALALAVLYTERDAIRAQVDRLVEAVKVGALAPADVAADRADLDGQSQALETRISALVGLNARAVMLTDLRRTLWAGASPNLADVASVHGLLAGRINAMSLEDQRLIVRHYLSVTVLPGRGVDRAQGGSRVVVRPRIPVPGRTIAVPVIGTTMSPRCEHSLATSAITQGPPDDAAPHGARQDPERGVRI